MTVHAATTTYMSIKSHQGIYLHLPFWDNRYNSAEMDTWVLTVLATVRMASGASFFAVPELMSKAFLVPYTGAVAVTARMAGARDLAVGALLYCSRTGQTKDFVSIFRQLHMRTFKLTTKKELRRELLAGIVIDAFDVLGYLWCYWEGSLPIEGLRPLGGGAVVILGVKLFALHQVSVRSPQTSSSGLQLNDILCPRDLTISSSHQEKHPMNYEILMA